MVIGRAVGHLVHQPVVRIHLLRPHGTDMQPTEMRGVDVAFQRLQPVALALGERDGEIAFRQQRRLDLRHRRRLGALAHVDPDHAGAFGDLVGLGVHLLPEILLRRQVRHVDAVAVGVVFPAVIDAADAAVLVASVEQRRAAVRAAMVHHADAPRAVAERDQFFPQQHQPQRIAAGHDFRRLRGRQPVLPHQIAHHRAWADSGELLALDRVGHRMLPLAGSGRWLGRSDRLRLHFSDGVQTSSAARRRSA